MPSTRSVVEIIAHDHLDRLPEATASLFDPAAGAWPYGLYATADWYRLVLAAALPQGSRPCFALATLDGEPAALIPLLQTADGAWQSLTTLYTCLYRPLVAPALDRVGLVRIGEALARFCRDAPSLRLDCLDAGWPGLPALLEGLRKGGLIGLRFDHFGNWHTATPGLSWQGYLAGRDGALRETIRRRTARALRDPAVRLEMIRGPDGIEPAIAAFEDVYARSWKQPEPHPRFNAGLIRLAAAHAVLRLALMWHGAQPIAVQVWIVSGGQASVVKLAHDEAFASLSPGTVLTAWVIRALLEAEPIAELDFGRGDDPYKRAWAGGRRQRIGILAVNPRCGAGLHLLARHGLGRAARWIKTFRQQHDPAL